MRDLTDYDIAGQPDVILVRKKRVPVTVRFADTPGIVQTLEGRVAYRAGDALVKGIRDDDRWAVERDDFLRTYAPLAPTRAGEDGRYQKRPRTVHALQMREPFSLRVGPERSMLVGKAGDWVVQYAPDQRGVLSADVFAQTYARDP